MEAETTEALFSEQEMPMGSWRVYIEGRERGKERQRDPWFNNGVWRV